MIKTIIVVGLGIEFAALAGCAAEEPSAAPPVEIISVGTPTPLTPASASRGAATHSLATVYRPGAPPSPLLTTPIKIDNSYHPSWTVDVIN
jgi:hypothetical protein